MTCFRLDAFDIFQSGDELRGVENVVLVVRHTGLTGAPIRVKIWGHLLLGIKLGCQAKVHIWFLACFCGNGKLNDIWTSRK